jgi:hypothetical protein
MVLFQAAAIQSPPTLYKCSMNPDRTPIPRMPRIADLPQFSTMGIRLSTCITTIEPISDWASARPDDGARLCPTVALLRGHGLGACTTVTTELPEIGHRGPYAQYQWQEFV